MGHWISQWHGKKGGLPEGQTDFIFAVIVEELGLIGGLLLLFLLLFLAASILRSSCVIKNHCYGLFLLGVGTLILAQTAINIGGVLGLIPMTGIPLPFVSYGGTSYLIFSVALGIVIKIIANERRQLNGQYKKFNLHLNYDLLLPIFYSHFYLLVCNIGLPLMKEKTELCQH